MIKKLAGLFILLFGFACTTVEPISAMVPAPTVELVIQTPVPQHPPTETPLPTIPVPTATITPTLPASFIIRDFYAHKQLLPLDCESAAAVDWAEYLGVKIDEYEFQHGLPISDNPEIGFVGYSTGPWGQVPPYAYGVHAAPIAARLQQYGLNAVAVKGYSLEQIKSELAKGHPVITWVIGNCVGGIPYNYTDKLGNTVTVAAYEHVIILYGFEGDNLYYFNAGKRYMIPNDVFLNSWGVLGNMAIVMGE
jgi:uncharacterized protein YvpB